ncbi:hypothetical protein F441_22409 [Phytophthora nicotianae CJ01A1]|uniref:Uncharacterized protein n=1 Tax=Phytophthora nicotianae CJ01A1 TaxID=1317063 RepID=W2VP95_PHYNI|nr:hypothetical protein F441_22409 [Phytophthora nicotianae CJ01A1]
MLSTQQSFRHVARPLVHSSRRDYGFQPRDAAETARRAAQQPLNTYVYGPAAATADEQVLRRHTLRERYLIPQVTTPQGYRERLQMQLNRHSGPSMRTIPVVLNPGESENAYEAQFQNWVERARGLPSYKSLRASFSEIDIRLERCLSLDFAKSKARRQLPGPRPQHHEASTPPAPPVSTDARYLEPAAPATGQSLSSAADLSSSHSSGKRSAPGDAVARHGGVLAPNVPDHKRPRRQGNLAGGKPQTPKRYVSEGNASTSPEIGYDPGDVVAPQGVPRGSGARNAHRAELEGGGRIATGLSCGEYQRSSCDETARRFTEPVRS